MWNTLDAVGSNRTRFTFRGPKGDDAALISIINYPTIITTCDAAGIRLYIYFTFSVRKL
jgi:hypothetical protein